MIIFHNISIGVDMLNLILSGYMQNIFFLNQSTINGQMVER